MGRGEGSGRGDGEGRALHRTVRYTKSNVDYVHSQHAIQTQDSVHMARRRVREVKERGEEGNGGG